MVVKINRYLIHSSIFKSRTVHSGIINAQQVEQFCLTGINARASGSDYDVRQHFPYEFYNDVAFDIPIKNNGDCYDRFCLRLLEITESIKIIKQCLPLPDGDFHGDDVRYYPSDDIAGANIIYHLMYEHKGINVPATDRYFSIEAGNGEIGVYINTDGARTPYRIRIRSSVFPVVCLLPSIVKDVDELDIIITSLGLLKNR